VATPANSKSKTLIGRTYLRTPWSNVGSALSATSTNPPSTLVPTCSPSRFCPRDPARHGSRNFRRRFHALQEVEVCQRRLNAFFLIFFLFLATRGPFAPTGASGVISQRRVVEEAQHHDEPPTRKIGRPPRKTRGQIAAKATPKTHPPSNPMLVPRAKLQSNTLPRPRLR